MKVRQWWFYLLAALLVTAWLPKAAQALFVGDGMFPVYVTPPDSVNQQGGVACVDQGSGAIIVAWIEVNGTDTNVMVNKIADNGTRLWGQDGVAALSLTIPFGVSEIEIVCPGDGGAIIAAAGLNSNGDHRLRLQRISVDGMPQWGVPTSSGLVLDPATVQVNNGGDTFLSLVYDPRADNPGVVVGYIDIDTNNDGTFNDPSFAVTRVDDAGVPKFTSTVDSPPAGYGYEFAALVAGNPGVVWALYAVDAVGEGVFARPVYHDTGTMLAATRISYNSTNDTLIDDNTPCVAASDLAGGALVACMMDADNNNATILYNPFVMGIMNNGTVYNSGAIPGLRIATTNGTIYGMAVSKETPDAVTDYFYLFYNNGTDILLDKLAIDPSSAQLGGTKWTGGKVEVANTPSMGGASPDTGAEMNTLKMAAHDRCLIYTWVEGGYGNGNDLYAQVICDDAAGTSALPMFTDVDAAPMFTAGANDLIQPNVLVAGHGSAYAVYLLDEDTGNATNADTYQVDSFNWEARPDLYWSKPLKVDGGDTWFDFNNGGQITLTNDGNNTIGNKGQVISNATTVRFYFTSANYTDNLNGFVASENKTLIEEVDLPQVNVGGTYNGLGGHVINIANMTDYEVLRCWNAVYLCAVIAENEDPHQEGIPYYGNNNIYCADINFKAVNACGGSNCFRGPDLEVTAAAQVVGDVVPGSLLDISDFRVANNGDRDAGPFEVCFYLWNQVFLGVGNLDVLRNQGILLGCVDIPGLAAGEVYGDDEAWPELQIPYDINRDLQETGGPDEYLIYAVVDPDDVVLETDEICGAAPTDPALNPSNFANATNEWWVEEAPDLWVDSSIVWPTDNIVKAGDTVQISYTVRNMGGDDFDDASCSAPTTAHIYLSTDDVFDPASDRELDSRPIPQLNSWEQGANNYEFSETINVRIPDDVQGGIYYVYVYVEPSGPGGGCNPEYNFGWQWLNDPFDSFLTNRFPETEIVPGADGYWYLGYGGRNASPVESDSILWVDNGDWSVAPTSLCLVPGETANVAVSGGIPPYNVAGGDPAVATAAVTDDGVGDNNGTVEITGVAAGSTTWTVDDASLAGLTPGVDVNVQVVDPLAVDNPAPTIGVGGSTDVNVTSVACGGVAIQNNSNPAAVNATLTGTVLHLEGLAAGNAVITLVDSAGHTLDVNVTVNDAVTVTAPACITMDDVATVNVAGGVPPYDVDCDPAALVAGCPGAGFAGGSFNLTPQDVGTVTVTATDASMASASASFDIEPALSADRTAVSVAVGESAQVNFTGGCGGCTLVDAGNAAVAQVSQAGCTFTVTGVAEGSTSFIVNDNVPGNTITVTVVVTGASPMTVSPDSLCLLSGESGSTQIFGGVAPYSVTCEGGLGASVVGSTVTVDATGVAPGAYTCTVDDSSAADSVDFTVTVAENVDVAAGSMEVYEGHSETTTVSGGCGAYTATSGDASVATAGVVGNILTVTGVAAGSTTVQVCDAVGGPGHCDTVNVDVLAYSGELVANPSAFNLVPGEPATSNISGGAPPYAVSTNTDPTVASASISGSTLNITANNPGMTNIVVRDNFGATTVVSVQVAPNMAVSPNALNLPSGGSDTAAISGGFAPYTCDDSAHAAVNCAVSGSTLNLTALAPTDPVCAPVTVTDSAGHDAMINVCVYPGVVANPGAFNLTIGGTGHATISGGLAPYTAASSNPAVATASVAGSDLTITGAAAGSAIITVSDSLGQSFDVNVQVYPGVVVNPDQLTIYVHQTASAAVSGGLAPYTVAVDDPTVVEAQITGSTVQVTGVSGGVAHVTITDQLGQTAELTVTVNDWVDLRMVDVVSPTSASSGQTFTINYAVENAGTQASEATRVRVYLSQDSVLDASDVPVALDDIVPALGAGESYTGSVEVTIPADTNTGNYYLLVVVDPDDDVAERYEDNNLLARSLYVSQPQPALPEISLQVFNVDGCAQVWVGISSCGDYCGQAATIAVQIDWNGDTVMDFSFLPGQGWVPGASTFIYPLGTVPAIMVLDSCDYGVPYSVLANGAAYFAVTVDGHTVDQTVQF